MQDVIIIGAGPAGLSLGCSLADAGFRVSIVEKQPESALANPAYDGREIALTHLSKHLMERMGSWKRIPADAVSLVKEAQVLDGHSSYALHFDYREVCDDTLGFMVSNHRIRKAIYEEAKTRDTIRISCDTSVRAIQTSMTGASVSLTGGEVLEAKLVVAADSRFSESRRHMGIATAMRDFGKTAIVCKVTHAEPHHDTAYECFRYGGTLAILPLCNNESSVVITVSSDKAPGILEQSAAAFSAQVTEDFQRRFGEMQLASERYSYPLVATYANSFIARRFALIGDAAVGMHPVTAHGFNLGLKGQHVLAEEMKAARLNGLDFASDSVLARYNRRHRSASQPLYLATNAVVQLYTDDRPIPRLLRKAVLHMGNKIRPAKRAIMHQLTEVEPAV